MCSFSRLVDLKPGEVLFNRGDTAKYFYFVRKGLIKLYRQSVQGQEKIFELQKEGRTFAEALMFLDGLQYPVSAAAIEPSTVVAINTREYLSILRDSSDSCLLVMGDLSRRLHGLIEEVDKLSLLSGRNRVASYFLDLYRTQGEAFDLQVAKNSIASLLSLQPETFSRLTRELKTKGALSIEDNHVRIIDEEKLKVLAGIA